MHEHIQKPLNPSHQEAWHWDPEASFHHISSTSSFHRATLTAHHRSNPKKKRKQNPTATSARATKSGSPGYKQGASETYQWIQLQVPRPRLPRNPLEPLPFSSRSRRGLHRRHLSRHSHHQTNQSTQNQHELSATSRQQPTEKKNPQREQGKSRTRSSGSRARGPDPGEGGVPVKRLGQREFPPLPPAAPTRGREGGEKRRGGRGATTATATHWPLLPLATSCSAVLCSAPPTPRVW
jgi:hypothetical protein